jgi:hypothetical protein
MVSRPDFRSWLASATAVSRATIENERPTWLSPNSKAMTLARKPMSGMRTSAVTRARTDSLEKIWAIDIGGLGGRSGGLRAAFGTAILALEQSGKWLRFDKNRRYFARKWLRRRGCSLKESRAGNLHGTERRGGDPAGGGDLKKRSTMLEKILKVSG